MVEIPEFAGVGKEKAKAIIKWVEDLIQIEAPSLLDIVKLGRRTPLQILSNPKTNPSFGCLDRASVIGSLLQMNGFEAFLVTDRIQHSSGAIGLHFTLQITDGKQQFTIDPRPLGTYLIDGWHGEEHDYKLAMPFHGDSMAKSVQIMRRKIPANAMNIPSFRLAGIKNKMDFLRLSGVKPLNFCKVVCLRSGKRANDTIRQARIRERKTKRAL